MGHFDGLDEGLLLDFLAFALDHHDVRLGGGDDEFEIGVLHLAADRVDDVLAIYARDAHLGDGSGEVDVGHG